MFSKEHFGHFLPLRVFSAMTSLHVCGGDFYSDCLLELLEAVGE